MKENRALLTLLSEMGVVEGTDDDGEPVYAEHVLCRDPHERLFAYGQWHEGLYLPPAPATTIGGSTPLLPRGRSLGGVPRRQGPQGVRPADGAPAPTTPR